MGVTALLTAWRSGSEECGHQAAGAVLVRAGQVCCRNRTSTSWPPRPLWSLGPCRQGSTGYISPRPQRLGKDRCEPLVVRVTHLHSPGLRKPLRPPAKWVGPSAPSHGTQLCSHEGGHVGRGERCPCAPAQAAWPKRQEVLPPGPGAWASEIKVLARLAAPEAPHLAVCTPTVSLSVSVSSPPYEDTSAIGSGPTI